MKINVLTEIKDLRGEALKDGDTAITMGSVLVGAYLAAPANPAMQPYSPDEQVKRYQGALAVENAKGSDGEVEIVAEIATKLKSDISRLYGPIVAGQALPLLDGK